MTANQIAYNRYLEEQRSHLVGEAETYRHNVATEGEAYRHNTADEYIRDRGNTLNYQASIYASDVSRYNAEISAAASRYSTDVNAWNVEQNRLENIRHNQAQEKIAHQEAQIKGAQAAETVAHNRATEKNASYNTVISGVGTLLNSITGGLRAAGAIGLIA